MSSVIVFYLYCFPYSFISYFCSFLISQLTFASSPSLKGCQSAQVSWLVTSYHRLVIKSHSKDCGVNATFLFSQCTFGQRLAILFDSTDFRHSIVLFSLLFFIIIMLIVFCLHALLLIFCCIYNHPYLFACTFGCL